MLQLRCICRNIPRCCTIQEDQNNNVRALFRLSDCDGLRLASTRDQHGVTTKKGLWSAVEPFTLSVPPDDTRQGTRKLWRGGGTSPR